MKITFFHIFLVSLLLAGPLCTVTGQSSGEISPLRCGGLLFIEVQEPYKIYINGTFKGITPLLLSDLPAGEFNLRLEGEQKFHEAKGISHPNRSGLTVYSPVPEKYKGTLHLGSNPPGSDIWLDGICLGQTPLHLKGVTEGKHQVSFFYPGYRQQEQVIHITRNTSSEIKADMERLYEISFEPPLLEGVRVTCRSEDGEFTFEPGETCLLPAGTWQLTLRGAGMVTETREIQVNDDMQLAFSPTLFDPRLVFSNLLPDSLVYIDFENRTENITENQLMVSAGSHNLAVSRTPFLDYKCSIFVLEDRETPVEIQYVKDPELLTRKKKTAGWITLGTGAAVSVIGMIINMDNVALQLSGGEYGNYQTIKYGSLGALGAGILAIVTGLVLQR